MIVRARHVVIDVPLAHITAPEGEADPRDARRTIDGRHQTGRDRLGVRISDYEEGSLRCRSKAAVGREARLDSIDDVRIHHVARIVLPEEARVCRSGA